MNPMTQLARTAIHKIIDEEGGWKYTDHPKDKDKGTYAGVRYKVFNAFYKCTMDDAIMTPMIFKDLAEQGVIKNIILEIYHEKYYNKLQLDRIADNMKMPLFSCGVNLGVRRGSMILQETVNLITRKTIYLGEEDSLINIKVDGVCGSKTCAALGAIYYNPLITLDYRENIEIRTEVAVGIRKDRFRNAFIMNWIKRYGKFVEHDHEQAEFINGWFNRAFKYWVY